jgi:hypothetical protein
MAIYNLLQNTPLGSEEIGRLVAAYEQTLKTLGLKERSDPITQMVAKIIIDIGKTGIEDPEQISKLALKKLGAP